MNYIRLLAASLTLTGCLATGPTAHWYLLDGSPFDQTKFNQDYNYTCYHLRASDPFYIINYSTAEFDEMCMASLGWGVEYR